MDLLKQIYKFVSLKWFYSLWGLSSSTAFFRTIIVWLVVSFASVLSHAYLSEIDGDDKICCMESDLITILDMVLLAVSDFKTFGLKYDIYEPKLAVFILGLLWILYSSFNGEFVSKYKRIAELHDEVLTKVSKNDISAFPMQIPDYLRIYLHPSYLNWCEDCLIYHIQGNKGFEPTFNRIISVAYRVNKMPETNIRDAILRDYCAITKYLHKKRNDQNFVNMVTDLLNRMESENTLYSENLDPKHDSEKKKSENPDAG